MDQKTRCPPKSVRRPCTRRVPQLRNASVFWVLASSKVNNLCVSKGCYGFDSTRAANESPFLMWFCEGRFFRLRDFRTCDSMCFGEPLVGESSDSLPCLRNSLSERKRYVLPVVAWSDLARPDNYRLPRNVLL